MTVVPSCALYQQQQQQGTQVGVARMLLLMPTTTTAAAAGGLAGLLLGDWGAEALAAGLGSNTTLKVLLLDRNHICQRGLLKVADALSFNCSLEALGILENHFDQASLSAFGALESHFLRVEPLALDFRVVFAGGEPRAIPNKSVSLLRQKAAALPPDSTPLSAPC
ncbi:hypothetical protein Esti_001484 [Eimeria stiedai]